MGRARKQTADYFPHFAADSRTKFVLENNWGNDGYAFWFKLLELLCSSDGHTYDCSEPANKMYLTARTRVSEETADKILDTLAEMEKIDPELWKQKRLIWCQSLVDNLAGMYAKRTTPTPKKPVVYESPQMASELSGATAEADSEDGGAGADTPPEPAENGKKSKGRKKDGPEKKAYAEFVKMTEDEYAKLVVAYGEEKTRRMIEILDNYKGSSGKTYKSDYRTILNWVVQRVNEEYAKGGGQNGGPNNSGDGGGFRPSGGFRQG